MESNYKMKEAMTYLYVTVKYASHHQPGRYSIEKDGVKYWSLTHRERDTLFLLSNSAILSDEKEDEIGSGKHKLVPTFFESKLGSLYAAAWSYL